MRLLTLGYTDAQKLFKLQLFDNNIKTWVASSKANTLDRDGNMTSNSDVLCCGKNVLIFCCNILKLYCLLYFRHPLNCLSWKWQIAHLHGYQIITFEVIFVSRTYIQVTKSLFTGIVPVYRYCPSMQGFAQLIYRHFEGKIFQKLNEML